MVTARGIITVTSINDMDTLAMALVIAPGMAPGMAQAIVPVMAIGVNTAMATIARDIAAMAATARNAGTARIVMATILRDASTEKRGIDDEICLDTVAVCAFARGEFCR